MSRDEWWFDYVEGELDAATKSEMKSLLKASEKDQELVKSISETKALLKQNTPEMLTGSEEFFEDLHDKIMVGIAHTEIREKPKIRLRTAHKRLIKTASISVMLLVVATSLIRHLSAQSLNTQWDISRQMAQHGHENPDDLAQMMSYQNEHDFFVDVASLSLDHLTKEQFESLLQTRRTR